MIVSTFQPFWMLSRPRTIALYYPISGYHIVKVIAPRPGLCMSNAWGKITLMQYPKRKRVNPMLKKVTNSVSAKIIALFVDIGEKLPITLSTSKCCPDPAVAIRAKARGFINIFPKPLNIVGRKRWKWFRIFKGQLFPSFQEIGGCAALVRYSACLLIIAQGVALLRSNLGGL